MGNEVTKQDLQGLQKQIDELNKFWDQSIKFDAEVKTALEGLNKAIEPLKKSTDELNKFWDQSLKFDASIKKAIEDLQKKCS